MWIAVGIVVAALVVFLLKYVFTTPGPNPFDKDTREPLKPLVNDHKVKNKVLKQGFLANKVPENLDAIVIGSGIGGLGLAVLLAKVGKRVLVLEQHDRAGGCCHTFTEKGFEFDVGIHYIGDLLEHKPFRCMLDQCTNGQLQWEPLDNPFDVVVIGPPENRRTYPIYSGRDRFPQELKKCFPGEEKAIDEYMRLVKKAGRGVWAVALLKLLPSPVAQFLVFTGLAKRLSFFFRMASRSLTDVVDGLTENKDLRAVFCYIFGTYGNMPKESSFSMHSLLVCHYLHGAWYPKGGASEIAYHMIPIIEKAGGAVLVRAPVNRILFNEANEAIGVSVLKGKEEVHVLAPIVVSNAGIFNTYQKLLPKELQAKPDIQRHLSMMKNGEGGLSIFLGLNGTKEELGLKADNYWIFTENNLDELMDDGRCGRSDYEYLAEIGEGAYGKVFKAREIGEKQRLVAVKKLNLPGDPETGIPAFMIREVALLRKIEYFNHPNIVKLLDVSACVRNQSLDLTLVFEYIDQDLTTYMNCAENGLSREKIKDVMRQLLKGLDFLHSNMLVHRDLKPDNILVSSHGEVKIADFGLARIYTYHIALTPCVVTLWYRAPEVLLHSGYMSSVDVWSAGCIFAELFLSRPLFRGFTEAQQLQKIFELIGLPNEEDWPKESPIRYSLAWSPTCMSRPGTQVLPSLGMEENDLLLGCLAFKPSNRISACRALAHPFLAEF